MATKNFFKIFPLLFLFFSCQENQKIDAIHTIQGEAQGSTYGITYIAKDEIISKKSIDSLLNAFDLSLSTYRNDSKISKINLGDSTIVVDQFFIATFNDSYKIYKETNGLFDPTIGVLVNAYGFGPEKEMVNMSQKQIDSLLQYVGFEKVKLNNNNTISKKHKATYFDFNAIAQGYSVDVVADFMKSKGIQNAIIEIGGELIALGKNTIKNKNWVIGIDDPLQTPDARKLIANIQLANLGMATSGNYRKMRYDKVTGEKFVHTINPKTGKPQKSNILSATVLAPTAMLADGYATAFMVMNLEEGIAFAAKHPELYVLIMYADENNEIQQYMTANFKKIIL